MANNIKVSLSIILPGSTMYSKQECFRKLEKPVKTKTGKVVKKNGKVLLKSVSIPIREMFDHFTMQVKDRTTNGENIEVHLRKCRPAKQIININEDAYNYMVGDERPFDFKGNWASLPINQRLYWHCHRTAQHLGGYIESIEVFE